jgi:TIR domain
LRSRPTKTYVAFGVEEVYDAFDEYEHANPFPPFSVEAGSVEEARREGEKVIEHYVDGARRRAGYFSTGTFVARVIQIADERGELVLDASRDLIRVGPFPSDERGAIPSRYPTRVCFLSYSSFDTGFANALKEKLAGRGYLAWFAPDRPDMPKAWVEEEQSLRERIASGVRAARVVLVVISDHSIASRWVAFEVDAALTGTTSPSQPAILGLAVSDLTSDALWLSEVRSRHAVYDLTSWQDATSFEVQFQRITADMDEIFRAKRARRRWLARGRSRGAIA